MFHVNGTPNRKKEGIGMVESCVGLDWTGDVGVGGEGEIRVPSTGMVER